MPLQMRIPKRGFTNPNRTEYVAINVERLQKISKKYNITTIDIDALVSNGIVGKGDLVKILGRGELSAALTVTAHACSESAKATIEKQGGTLSLV